jgi:hypothetical protein
VEMIVGLVEESLGRGRRSGVNHLGYGLVSESRHIVECVVYCHRLGQLSRMHEQPC